jgi:ketosteroid isomerase-like protein
MELRGTPTGVYDLFARYAVALDRVDGPGLSGLLTEDVTYRHTSNGNEVTGLVEGNEAVVASITVAMNAALSELHGRSRHVITSVCALDGDERALTVSAYNAFCMVADGRVTILNTGAYLNVAVYAKGFWKFRKVHIDHDLPA